MAVLMERQHACVLFSFPMSEFQVRLDGPASHGFGHGSLFRMRKSLARSDGEEPGQQAGSVKARENVEARETGSQLLFSSTTTNCSFLPPPTPPPPSMSNAPPSASPIKSRLNSSAAPFVPSRRAASSSTSAAPAPVTAPTNEDEDEDEDADMTGGPGPSTTAASVSRPTKPLPKQNPTLVPVPASVPKTPVQKESTRRLIVVLESACLEVYRISAGSGGRDGKGGKDAKYALLNCDDHQGILAKTNRDIADARPDITHQVSPGFRSLSVLSQPRVVDALLSAVWMQSRG